MDILFLSLIVLLGGVDCRSRFGFEPIGVVNVNETTGLGIVNGKVAKDGQFPWQVSLQVYVPSLGGYSHTCGGTLIKNNRVLTAAHCYNSKNPKYRVALGSNDLSPPGPTVQYIDVADFKLHPEYTGEVTSLGDIAVLVLSEDADTSNSRIAVKEMATKGESFTGEECTISGWGRTAGNEPGSNDLRYAEMLQISNDECELFYGSLDITKGNICIYQQPKSSCNGDSGGPMICSGKLAGVTSWGIKGCPGTSPSVYTRVSAYLDWVNKQ